MIEMKLSPIEQQINDLIRPSVQEMGYDIVQIGLKNEVLEILAEDPETGRIGIDECAAVSRTIAGILDEKDPIKGAYRLEVGSAGIDRPLTRPEDFERYCGFDTKIELDSAQENGQKRFRGVLKGLNAQKAVLETDEGETELDLANIAKARLVMSDALMKASKNGDIPRSTKM